MQELSWRLAGLPTAVLILMGLGTVSAEAATARPGMVALRSGSSAARRPPRRKPVARELLPRRR